MNLSRPGAILLLTALTLGTGIGTATASPSTRTSLCNYTSSQSTVREGSSGTTVKQAQCELNWGYAYFHNIDFGNGTRNGLTVDGKFGPNTLKATKDFQKQVGLVVDGIIGPNTWSELDRCAAPGVPAC